MALAKSLASKNGRPNIRVKVHEGGFSEATRKVKWYLGSNPPSDPDDLSFTSRDEQGRYIWWKLIPPNTDYWHVHQMLGRAYAFELLDLMNNPDAEYPEHILAYVTNAMMLWRRTLTAPPGAGEGVTFGFFEVISEYISTGKVNR